MQDQTRGIDWVNIIVGTDFNGIEGDRSTPRYFADIHLRIPLDATNKLRVEQAATAKKIDDLKTLLKEALKPVNGHGREKLIEALELK